MSEKNNEIMIVDELAFGENIKAQAIPVIFNELFVRVPLILWNRITGSGRRFLPDKSRLPQKCTAEIQKSECCQGNTPFRGRAHSGDRNERPASRPVREESSRYRTVRRGDPWRPPYGSRSADPRQGRFSSDFRALHR